MTNLSYITEQIQLVNSFEDLVSIPFKGEMNAICWERKLTGDFAEIVNKISINENMVTLDEEELLSLQLREQGHIARQLLIQDLQLLKAHGASPVLNVIEFYERDDAFPFFPTDVYSFHVDRSPIPSDTFLCTYYGEASEILPNSQAQQKILIPEIRKELKKLYDGEDRDFETFLSDNFFDLHYQALENATPINLGLGHLWRLAIDYPEMQSLPCVHRAPIESSGQKRLLMIC
ncbi:MAG: hypothetical protein EOO90_10360 [Pedobacter sp.]|nr:MAG: hypothetical protein EOO90_10360 [Pedobacter sp.]